MKVNMPPFSVKPRGLPSDLPLSDLAPLQEYIGSTGGLWKIYRSKLISSQVEVSVFVFDKNVCRKHKQKKTILNAVWKHVDMIQNIQKYSNVTLRIVLTAKENRRYVAYASEPVLGSLANIMGDYPYDISQSHAAVLNKMTLCEMEIKYGVIEIAEALSYLHLYEAMVHCDVSPRNIVVCSNGCWRLSGFHFVMQAEAPHQLVSCKQDSVSADFLQPDINFIDPCLFTGTPTQESDIFSLGMVITYVYNNAISLMEGTAVISELRRNSTKEVHQLYNERMTSAYNAIKSKIPQGLQHGLSKMISFDIDTRPTAQQLMMLGYYHDPLIKYLKRLNHFETLTEAERGVVLSKELPECTKHLPQTMLLTHVLPIVSQELELSHFHPGVIQSIIHCLSRSLSASCTQLVFQLINRVLELNTACQLTPEAHKVLMMYMPLLFTKANLHSSLFSPLPVVYLGLADEGKLSSTLVAITDAVKKNVEVTVLTSELIDEVKKCFVLHWRHGHKELCKSILSSVLIWLSTICKEDLSQHFTSWFVQLIHQHIDILDLVRDVIMTMISHRAKYYLSEAFIEEELSFAVERLIASDGLSTAQRQTLIQLVRSMEKPCAELAKAVPAEPKQFSNCGGQGADPAFKVPLSKKESLRRQSKIITVSGSECGSTRSNSPFSSSHSSSQKVPILALNRQSESTSKDPLSPSVQKGQSQRSSPEMAADHSRKLFQLDWSLTRGKHTSFGEMMAKIDSRATILTEGSRSPFLSTDNRAHSLQASSTQDTSAARRLTRRRSSLQAEHYRSLSAPAIPQPSSPQAVKDENPVPYFETSAMKSILERLDSLTSQCTSKNVMT
ncbi:SCY1-like protein 2 isoform X2 [Watersipora subatra]|uniref:SCY1-like protein 2 isoform X2 n=1 Tax=Watersipora subatra TaxID=2589382 RepID=UPI00355C393A